MGMATCTYTHTHTHTHAHTHTRTALNQVDNLKGEAGLRQNTHGTSRASYTVHSYIILKNILCVCISECVYIKGGKQSVLARRTSLPRPAYVHIQRHLYVHEWETHQYMLSTSPSLPPPSLPPLHIHIYTVGIRETMCAGTHTCVHVHVAT